MNKKRFLHVLTEYGTLVILAMVVMLTLVAGILDRTLYMDKIEENQPISITLQKTSMVSRKVNEINFELDTSQYSHFMYQTFGIDTAVYVDEELVYEDSLEPYMSTGIMWHKIGMEEEMPGVHQVCVRFLNKHNTTIFPFRIPMLYLFYFGDANIVTQVTHTEGFFIFFGIVTFIIGVILILFYLFHMKMGFTHLHTLYFGFLSVVTAFWTITPTTLCQALFPYSHARGVLFIGCILLYPLLFFAYLEHRFKKKTTVPVSVAHMILITCFVALLFLDIFHIEHIVLVYFIGTAIEWIIYTKYALKQWNSAKPKNWLYIDTEASENANQTLSRKEGIILLIQTISIFVIAIINVFVCNSVFTSTWIQILAILFIFGRFMKECTLVIETSKESGSIEMYKRIALVDSLTGINNRQAFTMALKTIDITKLCIVSFDINNLKYHNDTYGHLIGDKLLCDSASLLQAVYGADHVYRFGGDEFIALLENTTPEEQKQKKAKMNRMCQKFNAQSLQVQISIACGYAFYSPTTRTCEQIISAADEAMYQDKAYLKSIGVAFDVRDQKPETTPVNEETETPAVKTPKKTEPVTSGNNRVQQLFDMSKRLGQS